MGASRCLCPDATGSRLFLSPSRIITMKINIARDLRKYLPFLLKAQEDKLTEADTAQRIIEVFKNVLGYDTMTEISCEMELRSKYADIAIKIDSVVKLFVEVKAAGTVLRERHVDQGEMYAAKGNVQWVVLTNGIAWNLYHFTFGDDEGIEYEQVFAVTLSTESLTKDAEMLGILHRTAVKTGEHEKFWEQVSALSPASIGRALFREDVMRFLRRLIRHKEGTLIDIEDLAAAIHSLFTPEVKEQIGPPKIRMRKAKKADISVPSPDTKEPLITGEL
jgi:predicted type IV restriction endonuclease